MTRLIDADLLCEEFKGRQRAALRWKEKAILDGDEERSIRADATLAFLSEVKLTIDKAPTVDTDLSEYSDKLWKEAYERGHKRGYKEGYEQAILDGKTNFSRPKGEWIRPKSWEDEYKGVVCSNCGKKFDIIEWSPEMFFCYNCGSDMREELRKHFGRKEREDWNK